MNDFYNSGPSEEEYAHLNWLAIVAKITFLLLLLGTLQSC